MSGQPDIFILAYSSAPAAFCAFGDFLIRKNPYAASITSNATNMITAAALLFPFSFSFVMNIPLNRTSSKIAGARPRIVISFIAISPA